MMDRDEDKEDETEAPPAPRSDGAGVSTALKAADKPNGDSVDRKAGKAVSDALKDSRAPAGFSTHSSGFLATCAAEEMRLKGIVADLDAKITDLTAERTDAMLAFSMVEGARLAREKGLSA